MNLSIFNSLCYTAGWFWCVLLGIHGYSLLAVTGAVLLILLQLYCAKVKDRALFIQDVFLLLFSIPLGTLMEILFVQTGVIQYTNSTHLFPPIWIVCLYPQFSLLINHSLRMLKKSYLACFILGFLGAPLSYNYGGYLGGLTFPYPFVQTWIIIGTCWGLFLCILIKIANMIEKSHWKNTY